MATQISQEELLFFNGINGATGDYGLPPMTGEQLSAFIQGEARPENLDELKFRHQQSNLEHFGVKEGVDPKKLAETGWGVIFAHDADPAIKEALNELLTLRQGQAGDYYRIYENGDGYRPGESKTGFLARHGAGPGPADPVKVPYYLGRHPFPAEIPARCSIRGRPDPFRHPARVRQLCAQRCGSGNGPGAAAPPAKPLPRESQPARLA